MIRTLVFAFTFFLSAGAAAQLTSWQKVSGPDGSFTVEMPAAPKYTTQTMKTPSGEDFLMHVYLVDFGGTAYIAQTTVYPASVNVSNPKVNLQGGLDTAAKKMADGKWSEINWTTLRGLPAVDSVGISGGLAIRSFTVLSGRRIIVLTYAGPQGSARAADV
jgi:hypothetical protein